MTRDSESRGRMPQTEQEKDYWANVHSPEEKVLIKRLHTHAPHGYRIPFYAYDWWLRGVTLYLNDKRLPSVHQIRKVVQEESHGSADPTAAAAAAAAAPPTQ